jgi:putative protease
MEAAAASECSCILVDGEFDPPASDSMFSRTSEDEKSIQKTQKSKKPDVKWKKPEQAGQKKQIVSGKIRYICVLPPVFRVNNRDRIRQDILTAPEKGYSGIMVRTLEELSLAMQMDYRGEIIADASLYSWNGRSMAALAKDCGRIVCPLELNQSGTLEAVRAAQTILAGAGTDGTDEVMAKIVLPVYGRIPMMESAGCVRKTENLCSKKDGFWYLEDRRGMQLPVRCRCGICSNTIYNAVPLSLHQFAGRGLCGKAPVHLCMFTTEDARETRRILQFFSALPNTGKNNRSGRNEGEKRGAAQKKAPAAPFEQFTNGHYKTGAL